MSPFDHEHWKPGHPCPAIGCYRIFDVPQAIEAWGLGKYTVAEETTGDWKPSFFGRRVNHAKYNSDASASDLAEELGSYIAKFAGAMLPGVFDVVIAPPPNRAIGTSLVPMIADVVVNSGIAIRAHTLQKVGQVPVGRVSIPKTGHWLYAVSTFVGQT
ncbi:MAG: hypothetical protein EBS41_04680 [Actinobacteria bacterium]|nr:hypothetical protein [Actinomycetota bacterium]